MALEPVVADVAVTWMGAVGCALYLRFLLGGAGWRGQQALALLAALLTLLLFLRGVAWWQHGPWLSRTVLAVATLLPLAITLFCERILRRHHPLWLKLLAAAVTGGFFVFNLVAGLVGRSAWQVAFITGFAVVVLANGILLLQLRKARLGGNEMRLARALVVVALLSIPLLISDFRTLIGHPPVRLGAIGALLFVYVMLSAAANRLSPGRMIVKLSGWLVAAAALSLAFAAIAGLEPTMLRARFWLGLPVAYAWLLLTLVFISVRALSSQHRANDFLRWLQRAPLRDMDGFVASLEAYPATEDYRALHADDLGDYDLDLLWRVSDSTGPVSLQWARAQRLSPQADMAAAEQWLDMLERYEMTHALPVSRSRPLVVLLNLPDTAPDSVEMLRAGIVLHLARSLDKTERT